MPYSSSVSRISWKKTEFSLVVGCRTTMAKTRISAYTDKLSVKAGDTLAVMASADNTATLQASLVRLIHGDEHPDGPGFIEKAVASSIDREWPVRKQYIQKGNFLRVADPGRVLAPKDAFTLHAFVFPTLPEGGRQVILGRWSIHGTSGYALGIDTSGRLEFWVGDGATSDAVVAEAPLVRQVWYFVAVSYDPATGAATLYQEPVINRYNCLLSKIVPLDYRSHVSQALRVRPVGCGRYSISDRRCDRREPRSRRVRRPMLQWQDRPLRRPWRRVVPHRSRRRTRRGGRRRSRANLLIGTRAPATRITASAIAWSTRGRTACMPRASIAPCAARPAGTGTAAMTASA